MGTARLSALLPAAGLALMLAGCSGAGPTLPTLGAASTSSGAGLSADTGSLSPEEVAQSGPSAPINPFSDISSAPSGGREVIANPTMAEILAPAGGLPEIALGREDAPVTIVQYGSPTCPFCKRFHAEVFPALKRDYIDTGKVRYILRDFPIGRQSGQGSLALRCVPPEKYLALYGKLLEQQPSWVSQEVRTEPIFAVAQQVGLTRVQYDACRNDKALTESLKATKDRGRKLGIIGTPNFFIQDKLLKKAVDMAELSALIESAQLHGPVATAGAPAR